MKDLRYPMRRLLAAWIAATAVGVILGVFLCPVLVPQNAWFDLFHGLEFRPLWRLEGRLPDRAWLALEGALALGVGLLVWFFYTDVKPPPPPEPRSADTPPPGTSR